MSLSRFFDFNRAADAGPRHGRYPYDLTAISMAASNPATGEAVTYGRSADGGATLELEGGVEMVEKARRLLGAGGRALEPPFTWHLPALTQSEGSSRA